MYVEYMNEKKYERDVKLGKDGECTTIGRIHSDWWVALSCDSNKLREAS